jgi:ADP-heptose:LPS heptosyltransferase
MIDCISRMHLLDSFQTHKQTDGAGSGPGGRTGRTLVFRLSSLGDVILASSVLHPRIFAGPVDWVVAREFASLLRGHPMVGRVWEFDRKAGLAGWIELCRTLRAEGYTQVLDLHGSLRTRVAQAWFKTTGPGRAPRWRRFSKERWRLYGIYLFKKVWPKAWRPRLFVERFSRFAGGAGTERPDLTHLLRPETRAESRAVTAETGFPGPKSYYCVMPGSKWAGKRWAADKYLEVIREAPGIPVVLGGAQDSESHELVQMMKAQGIVHYSGVGRWSLPEVATVLAGSTGYVGNDTGLAHLAEALGVPALVVYGPTTPEMGFGPWRKESRTVGLNLGCRPCGKDGRRCYRPKQKYLCMTGLDASEVARRMRELGRPQ